MGLLIFEKARHVSHRGARRKKPTYEEMKTYTSMPIPSLQGKLSPLASVVPRSVG